MLECTSQRCVDARLYVFNSLELDQRRSSTALLGKHTAYDGVASSSRMQPASSPVRSSQKDTSRVGAEYLILRFVSAETRWTASSR